MRNHPKTTGAVDDYIASCAPEVQPILRRIRDTIRKAAPAADERISYRMPTFFQDGVLVHFAAFKNHIGMYPPVSDEALKPHLARYAGEKGNLRFPLDKPMPYALITKIVKARLKENQDAAIARKAKAASTSRKRAMTAAKKSAPNETATRETAAMPAKKKPTAAKPKRAADNAKTSAATPRKSAKTTTKKPAAKPKLLSGGNPQIPKGYGDAPVQAYIAAMPGWKQDVGRRLDALITRAVPKVRKAVKWNSPFYGLEDDLWFLSFHCFTKYIKVTFFRGTSLRPVPQGESKHKEVRYVDIYEDQLDEAQFTAWVKQASKLPGEKM